MANPGTNADRSSGRTRSDPGTRRGRAHDAEGAREAILNAAEQVFAEHGFDGARVDAIAEVAGYNKSLIFQYFGDKLRLYAAVIRRADEQTRGWQNEVFAIIRKMQPPLEAQGVREVLSKYVGLYYDYLVAHPAVLRIFNWEMAEGWQTFARVMTERDYDDVAEFRPILEMFQRAGFMRSRPSGFLQFSSALFMCHTFLGILPLYQVLLPGEDFNSPDAQQPARQFLMDFIADGLLQQPIGLSRTRLEGKRTSKP